jgi:hypothetical protein
MSSLGYGAQDDFALRSRNRPRLSVGINRSHCDQREKEYGTRHRIRHLPLPELGLTVQVHTPVLVCNLVLYHNFLRTRLIRNVGPAKNRDGALTYLPACLEMSGPRTTRRLLAKAAAKKTPREALKKRTSCI